MTVGHYADSYRPFLGDNTKSRVSYVYDPYDKIGSPLAEPSTNSQNPILSEELDEAIKGLRIALKAYDKALGKE